MAVRAYFEYPNAVKRMETGTAVPRALEAVRHPFFCFYRYYKKVLDIHPKQKLALGALNEFMDNKRKEFSTPAKDFYGERLEAFAIAELIAKQPNWMIPIEMLEFEAELGNTASLFKLSFSQDGMGGIKELQISGNYRKLLEAIVSLSGAEKGGSLAAEIMGSRAAFTLEADCERKNDPLGLELMRLCAFALGGTAAYTYGDSVNVFRLVLPVKTTGDNGYNYIYSP